MWLVTYANLITTLRCVRAVYAVARLSTSYVLEQISTEILGLGTATIRQPGNLATWQPQNWNVCVFNSVMDSVPILRTKRTWVKVKKL